MGGFQKWAIIVHYFYLVDSSNVHPLSYIPFDEFYLDSCRHDLLLNNW